MMHAVFTRKCKGVTRTMHASLAGSGRIVGPLGMGIDPKMGGRARMVDDSRRRKLQQRS
jgi:hypothetical protein